MAETDDDSSRHCNAELNPCELAKNPKRTDKIKFNGCSRSTSTNSSEDHNDSDSDSSSSGITLPPPPDGGWGWVVVFASFMIHFIADGCAFSFGVLYTELLDYFQDSRGKTAWVGSLFVSVPLLTGPIASALTNKYGCRIITMVGAVIASFGFAISTFSHSTDMLCLTFGVISGFGLSMVYVPAVVIVAFYFEKKRAFATGIAVAGSGIGNCVFAPLIESLIQAYGWRGAILILGGIMLQMVTCGALLRPLVPPSLEKKRKQLRLNSVRSSRSRLSSYRQSLDDVRVILSAPQTEGQSQTLVTHSLLQFPTYVNKKTGLITPDLLQDLKRNGKSIHEYLTEHNLLERFYAGNSLTDCGDVGSGEGMDGGDGFQDKEDEGEDDGDPETEKPHPLSNGASHLDNTCNTPSVQIQSPGSSVCLTPSQNSGYNSRTVTDKDIISSEMIPLGSITDDNRSKKAEIAKKLYQPMCGPAARDEQTWLNKVRPRFKRAEVHDQFMQPLARKDIFYRGNLLRPGTFFSGQTASCPDLFITRPTEDPEERDCYDRLKLPSLLQVSKEVKHIIRKMLDLSIFKSVIFNYFCLSCMFLYISYDVPYVYTVDKAVGELGITEKKASLLLSIIGLSSTVGQIVIGYIGDQAFIDSLHFYNALTSTAGVCTMLVPLMMSYTSLAVYCAAYGFFISANYALTTIILVDLLSMDKLTNAYGIVMLAEGVANVIGPPLAGWLSDYTGGYDLTFIVAGAIMVLSGIMLFAIPCLRHYEKRNREGSVSV